MVANNLDLMMARVQHVFYRISRSFELCDQSIIEPHGLTVSQGYALLAFQPKEASRMSELSGNMGLAGSTMTRMVDQLVRKGLVIRETDDQDRRVVRVGLTPRGHEIRRLLEMKSQELFKLVLLEIEEGKRGNVIDAMEMMLDAIERVAAVGNSHSDALG